MAEERGLVVDMQGYSEAKVKAQVSVFFCFLEVATSMGNAFYTLVRISRNSELNVRPPQLKTKHGETVLHTGGPWFGILYLTVVKKAISFQSFKMKLKTMLVEQ